MGCLAVTGLYGIIFLCGLAIAWKQCADVIGIADDPEDIPSAGLRLAVHPNPFNPQTTITFSLERVEWAKVGVYELTGKRLAVLADRTFADGEHSLLWNGRDAWGRAMPSGPYIIRLETDSRVKAQKIMLLK